MKALARITFAFSLLAAAASVAAVPRAQAQDIARNSVYIELLGNGGLYSLNYDRKITNNVSARVGLMAFGGESTDGDRIGLSLVPLMANYLVGKHNHRLELGGGPVVAYAAGNIKEHGIGEFSDFGLVGTATFGYRYQPLQGGFNFRLGFTPLFSASSVAPSFGVSFGYGF